MHDASQLNHIQKGTHRMTAKNQPVSTPEELHPAYLGLLREVVAADRAGLYKNPTPESELTLARMISVAPQSYFDELEARAAGAEIEWRTWARDFLERHEYPEFFALMKQVGDIRRAEGEEALHGPEHAGLFVRLMRAAPPRFKAEADAIADSMDLIPKATHVNDDGEAVFSLDQLADHLDTPVDELRAFAAEHLDASEIYRGDVHQLQ